MEFPGKDVKTEFEDNRPDGGQPQDATQSRPSDADAVTKLNEQLAHAQAQASEYLDNWRRSTAELSNARKRMQREQAEYAASANARLLEKLLPIVDDVDRAFTALPAEIADSEWVNGFRLIQRKLQSLLESEGVVVIQAAGQSFDPSIHYAVSHEEQPGFSDGDVIAEVAKGYKLGDRVLRPAMVRVAKGEA
jgi:molecular chaperone GrpE